MLRLLEVWGVAIICEHRRRLLEMTVGARFLAFSPPPLSVPALLPLAFSPSPHVLPVPFFVTASSPLLSPPVSFPDSLVRIPLLVKSSQGVWGLAL